MIDTHKADYQYVPGQLPPQALYALMMALMKQQGLEEVFFSQEELHRAYEANELEFLLPAKKDSPGGEVVFDAPGNVVVAQDKPVYLKLVVRKPVENAGAGPQLVM